MSGSTCAEGVAPEDAAAWALDDEPVPGIDLAAHLSSCEACRAAVASVSPARGLAERLRATPDPAAAARAADRAVRRVRVESSGLALVRALGGALGRVARAAPDYLVSRPATPTAARPDGDDGNDEGR